MPAKTQSQSGYEALCATHRRAVRFQRTQTAEMDDLLPTPQGVPPAAPIDLQDTLGETLVLFTHRLLDFREAELQAVAERSGLPAAQLRLRPIANDMPHSPLRLAAAMSDAKARELADHAVLVKVPQLKSTPLPDSSSDEFAHSHTAPRRC